MIFESAIYINHLGESVEFGPDKVYHIDAQELHAYEWQWNSNLGRVSAMHRSTLAEKKLPIIVAAGSDAATKAAADRLSDIMEADTQAVVPGTLYINGYQCDCYATAKQYGENYRIGVVFEMEITFMFESLEWSRGVSNVLTPDNTTEDSPDLDYPHDYTHDYSPSRRSTSIKNDTAYAADFVMRFFGPCSVPSITIGGNLYAVGTSVPSGAYLEVNSRTKTVMLYDAAGSATDLYNMRERGAKDSGTYIFQPILPGEQPLSWTNDYTLQIITYDKRSEPAWT